METRKPYTVENVRPQRTVRLYDRVLASAVSGGRTYMDLTEDEVLGEPCLRLLRESRLRLSRVPESVPHALQPFLPEGLRVESVAPAQLPPPPPVVEVAVEVEAEPVAVAEPPVVEDPQSDLLTEDSLRALTLSELRKLAKSKSLASSGSASDIVQRILAAQVES